MGEARILLGFVLTALVTATPVAASGLLPELPAVDLPDLGDPAVEAPRGTRMIVGFHEMVDTGSGEYGGARILDEDAALRFVTVDVQDREAFEREALEDPNVRYVEEDGLMHAFYTPNDPFWRKNDYTWGQWEIYADYAWDRTRGSTSAKLCVIDTGLYKKHEEFYGLSRVKQGYDFVYEDTNPNDPNGHGTHVAGIASAEIDNGKGLPGMARVTLIPIRVLNAEGSGTYTDIAEGIRYCADQGGHVASLSLGGGSSSTVENAVKYAQDKGVLVIAAVGNDGCNCYRYPAAYSGVLGVGAVGKDLKKASFSNTGYHVDIVAPGVDIVSTYKYMSSCGTACYVYLDGTSMATPFVSGTAALVKSYRSTWSASQIYDRLVGTAQDLGASGYDTSYGYGLVRADRAVS